LNLNDNFSEKTELEKRLGLTESLSIIVGRIIGSGIFRTPGPMMVAVGGSVFLFFGAWVIGGIATILSAILFAELAAMLPRSGGPYIYLKMAYPPIWTFLRGWAMFFVSETASIVAVALVFAEYGGFAFELATGASIGRPLEIGVAFAIIWLLTAANFFGVLFSGILQNLFSLIKLASLLLIAIASFSAQGDISHFHESYAFTSNGFASMVGVAAALRYGFFAYSGWEGATYVAEEIKNPGRNLPISLFLGIGGVMLIYLSVNAAYLYQLSPEEILISQKRIASDAMQRAAGPAGAILIAAAVMISTFGNVNAQILVKSRTWYSMARDGMFFSYAGKIDERFRTPNRALILQGIWASVLLIGASFAERTYETIIDFFSFTSAIFNISTFLSVAILRKKYPDAHRPYRAWGYPYTLWAVLLIHGWFMAVTLYDQFLPSMAGIVLTSTGFLYYYRSRIRACIRWRSIRR
jgi:amino acid transporter